MRARASWKRDKTGLCSQTLSNIIKKKRTSLKKQLTKLPVHTTNGMYSCNSWSRASYHALNFLMKVLTSTWNPRTKALTKSAALVRDPMSCVSLHVWNIVCKVSFILKGCIMFHDAKVINTLWMDNSGKSGSKKYSLTVNY